MVCLPSMASVDGVTVNQAPGVEDKQDGVTGLPMGSRRPECYWVEPLLQVGDPWLCASIVKQQTVLFQSMGYVDAVTSWLPGAEEP